MKTYQLICILLFACSGCTNLNPMAFDGDSKNIDTKDKSIVLMSIKISRPEKSRFVPHPLHINLNKENKKDKPEYISFKIDNQAGEPTSEYDKNIYKVRFSLTPGTYTLTTIFGDANAFPFHGFFYIPIFSEFIVKSNSIGYIGRVNALLRPRKDDEFRAGPLIPLIDQAASGVSTGTFEISIEDKYNDDVLSFLDDFPVLNNLYIEKLPLLNFNMKKAIDIWTEKSTTTK